MANFDPFVAEHIRRLNGYAASKPAKQAAQNSGIPCIRMASNENPFGPSPRALEAMHLAAASVHWYPDNEACELRNRLAARADLRPDQVLVTAGSTHFLDIVAHALLAPGLNAVTSERSFVVYAMATEAAGGTLKQAPMHGDSFDLDRLLQTIDGNTRVAFIANPNNPTGTLLEAPAITRFLERVPTHVLVVLDEAYFEFAQFFAAQRGLAYSGSLDYVRAGHGVVVLRTFSKAQGLAGLRVGYGYGPSELMEYFTRERTAFSVSALAQAAALAALEDEAHVRRTLENNAAGAAVLGRQLSELGLRVVPTWGNFLYVEVGEAAASVAEQMQQAGILVRPLTGLWGAPRAIRISIGTPEQNENCICVLTEALKYSHDAASRPAA